LRQVVPPRGRPSHLQVIYESLVRSRPGAETQLADALKQAASRLQRRGVLVLISDCFDDVPRMLSALRYFRLTGSEVVVFQIWDPDEIDFPFRSRTQFRSLEAPSQLRLVDPHGLRKAYLQRVAEFRSQLSQGMAQERIELVSCTTDQDYTEILSAYISRRNSRKAPSKKDAREAREPK
jgi:hypothetical protein